MVITKTLLKKVLKKNVVKKVKVQGNIVSYCIKDKEEVTEDFISIYELCFKIKNWALEKSNAFIESATDNYAFNSKGWAGVKFNTSEIISGDDEYDFGICAKTEVEAIIKAGEWLANKDKTKK